MKTSHKSNRLTILGINNEGLLVFDYYHEDSDKLGTANVFNGAESTLWTNFKEAFPKEIKELYQELRSTGKLSYDKIMEYFVTRQSDKWSISIYNEDSDYKYISMLRSDNDATNLYQIRGTGEEHLKYFAKNRLMYLDSKWYGADYADDYMSLRIYTPSGKLAIPANADITVTPFSDIYAGVMYRANGTLKQQRAKANVPITFKAPNEVFNDTETAVYGASEISSIGDLAPLYCGTVNVSKASKLTELIVGSGVEGYSNPNLKELAVGTNKLLKKIDIRNCPNYTSPLQISNCPNIQEIYATGSGITGLELPESGYLKKVYLPSTLTNLTVTNQQYIQEFTLEGYDNLTTLRIENTINIPVEDIMLNAPNLNRIRLLDISWAADSEAHLKQTIEKFKSCLGLDASGNNTDKAVVTGRVTVPSISDELFNDIYENFPNLVVDDGSGKPYIINYKDRDGKSLYVVRVEEGANAYDPIEEGYIKTPEKIETETYKYTFIGWSTLPTNIHKHYIITAQYSTEFAIKYYNEDTLIYRQWAIQGDSAVDPVSAGLISTPAKDGTDDLHYVFSGWDNLPTNVQSATAVYAQFSNVYPVRFYTDSNMKILHHVQWVVEGENAHDPVVAGDCAAPADIITENEKKLSFSDWNNLPQNVTAINKVYANYDTYWAARFLNDGTLYLLEWVLNDSDVIDPKNYFENYKDPTRASTAQYDYTFSKWDGDFKAITKARDYNAVYSSTIRRYKVYFYNDTTLLQTVENVQYGSSVNYTGSTPTKLGVDNPEEYVFKGWLPAPENITGETKCYALFKFTGYLFGKLANTTSEDQGWGTVDNPNWTAINAYWDTIAKDADSYKANTLSEEDFMAKYPIGGRMIIPVALQDNTVIADVEIIGQNHDNLADDSGKVPLTFFCVDLPLIQHKMNEDSKNDGGWKESAMREFTNGDLLSALPAQLKSIIKPVYKISDGGRTNKSLVTTTDSCWIASYEEVGFGTNSGNLSGQGEVYASIFTDNDSRKKYVTDSTEFGRWWLRSSCYSDSSSLFYRVQTNGAVYTDPAFTSYYVAFGFCIGGE